MHSFILVIHILLAVLMIVLILVQHGKGADAARHLVVAVRQRCLVHRVRPAS